MLIFKNKLKMKKLILVVAVATLFTACNSSSVEAPVVDSTNVVDSVLIKAIADTTISSDSSSIK